MFTNEPPLVVSTPKKKPHKSRCLDCPCQQFQSENVVTSAVDSDAQMDVLVEWLKGTSSSNNKQNGNAKIFETKQLNPCPNRLHASIAILNAIRDACRPYLESSTSVPSIQSTTIGFSSPSRSTKNDTQPNFIDNVVTYEDSFPSLSASISSSTTAQPTMLVGRKKNKDKNMGKSNTVQSVSSKLASAAAVQPTLLVGRKKSKGSKNRTVIKQASHNGMITSPQRSKAKKRIKPVTISLSSTDSSLSKGIEALQIEGNISSLPSQDTTEVLGEAANEIKSPNVILSTDNTGAVTDELANESIFNKSTNTHNEQKLKRLVKIYATIIRFHLAPSLLMELHLLVRLLSLSENGNSLKTLNETASQQQMPFSDIFPSEQSCIKFAAETLTSLEDIIVNMGHETIKLFVALSALQRRCPELCKTLQDIISAGNSELILETDQKALGSNTNTPHLTLPFDHARDSRHNFRSPDLGRQFKEREELRDSFLYQLRAFQDVRGRLVEHEQAEKCIDSIKNEARAMLKKMSSGNTLWFVNFVCELLCQVGLVPISETDSEVLKQIGDKKRLQKLHMRFTSKSGQTNKSSRKLRIDQKGSTSSAKTMPQQSFTGHQEFFFLFLQTGDSYKFNMHMKCRLAQMITEMSAVNATKGLCEHISKTQMLAKFLGMLVFSPNWDISGEKSSTDSIVEHDEVSNLSPINVQDFIESAWKHFRLIVVIPWVVQYLGMMKWDEVSRRSRYYRDTFTLLWSIYHQCFPIQNLRHGYYQSNMTVVISFQLDTFFRDVVGLAPSQNLAVMALPEQEPICSTDSTNLFSMDNLPLFFGKAFLFTLIPQLKDLCELIRDLTQNNGRTAVTSSAKKVRPHTVRKISFSGSFSGDSMSPFSGIHAGTPSHKIGIKERLVDAFFHQHKDLQQLCEVIADRAIKNFTETSTQMISPIFKNGATSFEDYLNISPRMNLEEYKTILKSLELKADEEATALMSNDFDRIIRGALHLLAPRETKPKVVEVASTLAINHAKQKGKGVIRSIVAEEKKKLVDEFTRKEKKVMAGVPLKRTNANKGDRSSVSNFSDFGVLADLTDSLRALQECDNSVENRLEILKEETVKVIDNLQRYFVGAGTPQTVTEFEIQIISMLNMFFSNPSHTHLLGAIIEVGDVLYLLGKLGYYCSSKMELESLLCDTGNLLTICKNASQLGHETIANFLFMMVEGSFVCYRALERGLLQSVKVNEDAKVVAQIVLNKLASSRFGVNAGSTVGLVIMVRLQTLLSKDGKK